MELLNALLMLSMNEPSFEVKNEVLKILEKAFANYGSLDHQKNRIIQTVQFRSGNTLFKYGGHSAKHKRTGNTTELGTRT